MNFKEVPNVYTKYTDALGVINTEIRKKEKEVLLAKEKKKRRIWGFFILVIGVLLFIAINDSKQSNNTASDKENMVSATSAPSPVGVYNGKMFISPSYKATCPFTITADSTTDYYVYLKYQGPPQESLEDRIINENASIPYESDISFYLSSSESVKVYIPIGRYKLYYATGDIFYGTKLLFGSNTKFYTSNYVLDFYSDSQYYQGHTVTLKKSSAGNFDTDLISQSSFPVR